MVFHDEDALADVVNATVHTIKEASRQIGRANGGISAGQAARIEEAIKELRDALHVRKRARGAAAT